MSSVLSRSILWPHTIDIYALYSHTTYTLTMRMLLSEARYTYHHTHTVMTGHTPSYTAREDAKEAHHQNYQVC